MTPNTDPCAHCPSTATHLALVREEDGSALYKPLCDDHVKSLRYFIDEAWDRCPICEAPWLFLRGMTLCRCTKPTDLRR